MKQVLVIMAAAFACLFCSQEIVAQNYTKDCRKAAEKSAKKEAKQLKKEQWVYNGALPLEDALTRFYLEIGSCGNSIDEPPVLINGARSVNIGTHAAEKTIQLRLVSRVRSEVMGKSTAEINEDEQTFDDKMASKYKATLINVYRPQFTLYKPLGNGKYDVRVYFTVDKDKLERLENKMRREYENIDERSDKIWKNVRDAFEDED